MRRLLALVFALALVGGALWFNDRRQGDTVDSGDGGGSTNAQGVTRIACATELRSVCEQAAAQDSRLKITVEPAGTTADRLSAAAFDPATADVDAWLTSPSWTGIVAASRQLAGVAGPALGETGAPLATTPLVLVGWADRWTELTTRCGGVPTWPCLADLVAKNGTADGVSWGQLKVGYDPPSEALAGPAQIGQIAAGLLGRPDVASNDLDEPALQGYDVLAAARPEVGTVANPPLRRMLQFGPSRFDVVGTADALARAEVGARTDVVIAPSAPAARLDLVLVPLSGRPAPGAGPRAALAEALEKAGWLPASAAGGSDGLPSGGTLEALGRR
jgi:hypothetical protein